ncbi:hypothetical protein LIS04_196 [Listeria phage LIS04]|nr:hypothetical protein LIS04_196 [Listeria phage LIS04]
MYDELRVVLDTLDTKRSSMTKSAELDTRLFLKSMREYLVGKDNIGTTDISSQLTFLKDNLYHMDPPVREIVTEYLNSMQQELGPISPSLVGGSNYRDLFGAKEIIEYIEDHPESEHFMLGLLQHSRSLAIAINDEILLHLKKPTDWDQTEIGSYIDHNLSDEEYKNYEGTYANRNVVVKITSLSEELKMLIIYMIGREGSNKESILRRIRTSESIAERLLDPAVKRSVLRRTSSIKSILGDDDDSGSN